MISKTLAKGSHRYTMSANELKLGDNICFQKAVINYAGHIRFKTIHGAIVSTPKTLGENYFILYLLKKPWKEYSYKNYPSRYNKIYVPADVIYKYGVWRMKRITELLENIY